MTLLESGPRAGLRVSYLGTKDRAALQELLDASPYVHAVLSARLRAVDSLTPRQLGGTLLGIYRGAELIAACFNGGNVLPVGGDPQLWDILTQALLSEPRVCTSVVGPEQTLARMWPQLSSRWGHARSIRASQPLLIQDTLPGAAPDEDVAPATPAQLDRYVPAAAAMFTEELGISPHESPGTGAFRSRLAELIDSGRALARCDQRGQVIFKAEIGAVTEYTAQVQGVWVRPDVRGRGIGTAGMASVIHYGLQLAPTVSLYVNDFNISARRMYETLGMRQVETMSTVLL